MQKPCSTQIYYKKKFDYPQEKILAGLLLASRPVILIKIGPYQNFFKYFHDSEDF